MEITTRQDDLLFDVISEHIRTGEPVSSEDLRKRYRFPYSPATIRNELLSLTEVGYLFQPHTSSGRVPTDSGYRWYADKIAIRPTSLQKSERDVVRHLSESDDLDAFFRSSLEAIAEVTNALAIGGAIDGNPEPFFKSGFSYILSEPEFHDQVIRNAFGELIDSIDEEVRELLETENFSKPRVYIGKENPIQVARPYSMIITTIGRSGTSGVIAILGSKRMRYDKGISMLKAVNEYIENEI